MRVAREEARLGGTAIALGVAPFAAGAAVAVFGRDTAGSPLPCVLRSVAGVPCPLCGGTRAFELAATGDPGFLSYNAAWVVLAALVILGGVVALLAACVGRAPVTAVMGRVRTAPVFVTFVVVAVAWAVALVNRGTIVA